MFFALAAGAGAISSCFATSALSAAAKRHHATALRKAAGPEIEELTRHADTKYLRNMYGIIAFQALAIGATGFYLRRTTPDNVAAFVVAGIWGSILFCDSFENSTFIDTLVK